MAAFKGLSGRIMDPTVGNRGIRGRFFANQWICERGNEDLTVDQAVSLSGLIDGGPCKLCSNFAMTGLERYG